MTSTTCQVSFHLVLAISVIIVILDELGLHRMENPSHVDGAVSLHLYCPPYGECQTFDQRTGVKSKAIVTFFTKYGRKVDYKGSKEGKMIAGSSKHEKLPAIGRTVIAETSLVKKG